ncbi:MAG: class I SAM-dependent methyltransferase [Pirellulales bacterium]
MPLSLNLPYAVCWLATRLARRACAADAEPVIDASQYVHYQYRSSGDIRRRFMQEVPLAGQVVVDVGSGLGGRAPYFVEAGAQRVHCVDINREELSTGAQVIAAEFPAAKDRIQFSHPGELAERNFADVAVLVDCFEHLRDPAAVLDQVHGWLRPGGLAWIGSIGWYHYRASHCISHIPIPWCQLLFSERALLDTIRSLLRSPGYQPNHWERLEGLDRWDGIETLKDRPGEPLNMLSLRGVRRVMAASPLVVRRFQVYGFAGRRLRCARLLSGAAQLPLLDEVFHSYYAAVLVKPC